MAGMSFYDLTTSGSTSVKDIVLDDATLNAFYTISARYVYYVTGLTATDTPCSDSVSRWHKVRF